MRKYIGGLSLIIAGFTIGVIFMGLLSMKSSNIYMETARINYSTEQEALAVRAQKDGDFNKSLVHYSNLVYATSSPGIRFFETRKWSFLFPFASIFIQAIGHNIDTSKIGQERIEGINRGKLAIILEALERKNEAEEQYHIAANLLGIDNVQSVKEKVKSIQEQNMQNWLQLE